MPVVFAFHGHGGSMQNAARSFGFHTLWPEAVVVYPQGLNTPDRLTDPEGKKPGWQSAAGDQGDRDLKFFDAVLKNLRQDYKVDSRRIYAIMRCRLRPSPPLWMNCPSIARPCAF